MRNRADVWTGMSAIKVSVISIKLISFVISRRYGRPAGTRIPRLL